jgi:5-hydroxyisourate hydrolase
MTGISTHVLDTANGCPASGVKIEVFALEPGRPPRHLSKTVTNSDGRTETPVIAPEQVEPGFYELVFYIGDYFAGMSDERIPYLGTVPIRVGIADAAAHYHVALLVTPWSYTTYRGS